MGGEELSAEFERLGEVEVIDRIIQNAFDQYMRAYALRWLSSKAMDRVMADQRAAQARRATEALARRSWSLLVVAVILLCLAAGGLLLVSFLPARNANRGAAPGLAAPSAAPARSPASGG